MATRIQRAERTTVVREENKGLTGEGRRAPAIDAMQRTADLSRRSSGNARLRSVLEASPSHDRIHQLRTAIDARPISPAGQVVQRLDPLSTGLIIGGSVIAGLGALGAAGYGLYRYFRGSGEEHRPLREEEGAPDYDTFGRDLEAQLDRPLLIESDSEHEEDGPVPLDPFTFAWNATQRDPIGERVPFNERDHVLIISESTIPREATGGLHPDARTIKTYYPEDPTVKFRRDRGRFTPDETWEPWDWLGQDFPRHQAFDFVIARSMVCACEDAHFHGLRVVPDGEAVQSTCGGVGPDQRAAVLHRVLPLIAPGGRAIFTVSLQGGDTPSQVRSRAREATRQYWQGILDTLGPPYSVSLMSFPENEMGEPAGDFFGFVISRDGD